jgi:hypothetical protein
MDVGEPQVGTAFKDVDRYARLHAQIARLWDGATRLAVTALLERWAEGASDRVANGGSAGEAPLAIEPPSLYERLRQLAILVSEFNTVHRGSTPPLPTDDWIHRCVFRTQDMAKWVTADTAMIKVNGQPVQGLKDTSTTADVRRFRKQVGPLKPDRKLVGLMRLLEASIGAREAVLKSVYDRAVKAGPNVEVAYRAAYLHLLDTETPAREAINGAVRKLSRGEPMPASVDTAGLSIQNAFVAVTDFFDPNDAYKREAELASAEVDAPSAPEGAPPVGNATYDALAKFVTKGAPNWIATANAPLAFTLGYDATALAGEPLDTYRAVIAASTRDFVVARNAAVASVTQLVTAAEARMRRFRRINAVADGTARAALLAAEPPFAADITAEAASVRGARVRAGDEIRTAYTDALSRMKVNAQDKEAADIARIRALGQTGRAGDLDRIMTELQAIAAASGSRRIADWVAEVVVVRKTRLSTFLNDSGTMASPAMREVVEKQAVEDAFLHGIVASGDMDSSPVGIWDAVKSPAIFKAVDEAKRKEEAEAAAKQTGDAVAAKKLRIDGTISAIDRLNDIDREIQKIQDAKDKDALLNEWNALTQRIGNFIKDDRIRTPTEIAAIIKMIDAEVTSFAALVNQALAEQERRKRASEANAVVDRQTAERLAREQARRTRYEATAVRLDGLKLRYNALVADGRITDARVLTEATTARTVLGATVTTDDGTFDAQMAKFEAAAKAVEAVIAAAEAVPAPAPAVVTPAPAPAPSVVTPPLVVPAPAAVPQGLALSTYLAANRERVDALSGARRAAYEALPAAANDPVLLAKLLARMDLGDSNPPAPTVVAPPPAPTVVAPPPAPIVVTPPPAPIVVTPPPAPTVVEPPPAPTVVTPPSAPAVVAPPPAPAVVVPAVDPRLRAYLDTVGPEEVIAISGNARRIAAYQALFQSGEGPPPGRVAKLLARADIVTAP